LPPSILPSGQTRSLIGLYGLAYGPQLILVCRSIGATDERVTLNEEIVKRVGLDPRLARTAQLRMPPTSAKAIAQRLQRVHRRSPLAIDLAHGFPPALATKARHDFGQGQPFSPRQLELARWKGVADSLKAKRK
jgi:hypothetical protein